MIKPKPVLKLRVPQRRLDVPALIGIILVVAFTIWIFTHYASIVG